MRWIKDDWGGYNYEYMRPHWRLGIALEEDPNQSGWFFIYKKGSRVCIRSGKLSRYVHWVIEKLFRPAKNSL
jgi:hypothetical protein